MYKGAAIESFRSRIVSYLVKFEEETITDEALIKICDRVAQDFQIQLGTSTIPMLLLKISSSSATFASRSNTDSYKIEKFLKYTGRILIDLSDVRMPLLSYALSCTNS